MAKNLGETSDPTDLVPGNPGSVTGVATAMRGYGDALHTAGTGLKRIDTTDGWSGQAGDAFREAFQGVPDKWLVAGDCFHNAATALDTYVWTLNWAQGQAADAVRQWDAGQSATGQAKTQHAQDVQQAGHDLPFNDPGEAARQSARSTLANARSQLSSAGDTAAKAVGAARDKAPKKPGFWDNVGSFFEDAGADVANFAGTAINDVASLGNAMLNHPGDLASTAGGVALMALGAAGEVGGGALDVTVVGAAIGVPVNIASAGAIGLGGTLAAAGMGDMLMNAAGDDSVHPMRTDYSGSGGDDYEPDEGFRGSEFSKDEIVEFTNGHTGDGDPTMGRPSRAEIDDALTKGQPQKLPGQNAEKFEYNGVRVIVNYDMPWKSTSYYPGR
ncbi:WXG100 family type VII secretion target [Kitasatospora kifunensis]|uniref:Putative T7SS secretion signal domain-containing protein n=1 Tax=Kitasatospora kifunensis TaxID=58351 RepID=A0A7W7QY35_KITKI|nr:hypothetical protein [Kitasatospora kifunensis]MBB4921955.1 hypothetical protein [Kitasatospora kifunensis]